MLIRKTAKVLKSVFTNEHVISKMQSALDTADSNMYNNKKHKKL